MTRNFRPSLAVLALASALTLGACGEPVSTDTSSATVETVKSKHFTADKFTYANYDEVRVSHVHLDLNVNFASKVLIGTALLDVERIKAGATLLKLDTKNLTIRSVTTSDGAALSYMLGNPDPVLGQALTIVLGPKTDKVHIAYETSPSAEGLQWLSPEQTRGKTQPYLFSQAQALNARSIAPLQDTPAVRMTYTAELTVPEGILPLMSAEQLGKKADGKYHFNMPQPIPSYLLAIAAGDIKFKAINDHIGVYAEDYILDASAEEFSETPLMEAANEKLYGPYRWGRYDLIVLPPSFPFGGMENPRLSFMTPTLIAGDKSLTNVVAHELAHSWSGNLVTNSNWRDAWLNEGFTSYVENRVIEDLYGEGRAVMEQALGLADLKRDIADAKRPELTQLKLPEDLAHPDDAFTQVAYVKGQFFLMFLEERFGREAFDLFLKAWFNDHAFKAVTTEDFVDYLHSELHVKYPDALTKAELTEWIYQPGLPTSAADPQSDAFAKTELVWNSYSAGYMPLDDLQAASTKWSTHEWLHFIKYLENDSVGYAIDKEGMATLDAALSLTGTQNAETAFAWYMQAIRTGYEPAMGELETFLMTVGRGKFIYRLYRALNENGRRDFALRVFDAAGPGYHPIAQRRIGDILKAETGPQ